MTDRLRSVRVFVQDGVITVQSNVGDETALAMLEVAKIHVLDRITGRAPKLEAQPTIDKPVSSSTPAAGLARTVA